MNVKDLFVHRIEFPAIFPPLQHLADRNMGEAQHKQSDAGDLKQ
jgi:hypothetical protein